MPKSAKSQLHWRSGPFSRASDMIRFSVDAAKISVSETENIQQLCADGKPAGIFLTTEEVAFLQRAGPNIGLSALEAMFDSSPNRLAMLRNISA
jgi:hypothetical protein